LALKKKDRERLEDRRVLIRMCVFAGLLMLCMMCVLSMCSSRIQSGVMRDEYGARYGDLQQRMNDATSRQQEVSDLKSLAGKVVSAGTAVASLQSSFAKPGVDVSAAIENLKSYMTESAQAQCFGWYAATGAAVAPVWEFDITYGFSDTEVSVMWTCVNGISKDEVLAYATACYSVKTGLFYDVSVKLTTVGGSYLKVPCNAVRSVADVGGVTIPEAQPVPEDAQPEDAQPEDAQPEDAQPEDAQPEDAQPEDAQPEDAQPEEGEVA
jgi:hypothetical protein